MFVHSEAGRTTREAVDLVRELVGRDLKLRYRRSALGLLWSQVAPLFQLAVLIFVFRRVVPIEIDDYPVFVFTGLLVWTWFQGAVAGGTESVVVGADLVRQPRLPLPLLPVIPLVTHLMHLLLSLPLLLVAIAVAGDGPHGTIAALPLLLAVQALLCVGPALVLSAVHVTFRDTGHIVALLLLPLFYATPVFYDETMVPDRCRWAYDMNPVAQLLSDYRNVLMHGRWPDWTTLAVLALGGAAGAFLGRRVFVARSERFSEEV